MKKMKQHWKIGVIYIFICFASIASDMETSGRFCEPIKIPMCQNLGYNMTKMPNLIGHELQSDVDLTLQTFTPLIQYGCSSQLNFFLCASYLPMCSVKVNKVIPPCRKLCETVRARCSPVLFSFGFSWPQSLDCNRFPKENGLDSLCMDPPLDIRDSVVPMPTNKVKTVQPACQYLLKSNLYVRLNRSNRCVPLCEADIVFDSNEKHMAEMWIFSWSMAALFLALLATLCLILSNSRWDKKIMPLVICHFMSNVSWAIRILAGRNATSCSYDPQLPGISLLLSDGLSTSPCSSIFLLRYYFGMSAPIWVAILSYGWNNRVKHHIKEAYGSVAMKNDKHNTLFQILSFGIPALLTVITLIARYVDADELLGTCFVGNQNDKALLFLVALPLLVFWMISCGYLLSGYLRSKNLNLPAQITGLGTFLFIYNIPSAVNICTMFYQFGSRESWLIGFENHTTPKAPIWPFILQPFIELLIGVLTSSWAIGPRIIHLCRSNVKQPPPVKPLPSIKYQPSPYNSTSYQTICPPNSSVSMTSIGTINKIPLQKHARMYSHSSLPRKGTRSSYRMTSVHSFTTTGNETVL